MVSKKDRTDYKRGQQDKELGFLDKFVNDLLVTHPDTKPYYKARRGEQLDADKGKRKK